MSLLWLDGFDGYGTTNNEGVGANLASSGYAEVEGNPTLSTNTRTGIGMSLDCSAFNFTAKAIADQSSVFTGFAVNSPSLGYSSLVQFRYNTYLGSEYSLLTIFRNANGALTAVCENKDQSIAFSYHSAANVMFPNVWQYVEVLYTPGASGLLTVKVDGVAVISENSVPTVSPQLPNTINVIGFFLASAPDLAMYVDDWYILANDSSGLSAFQGDVVVHAVFPASDAGPNQMTQFGGAVGHFTTVNDPNASDDTAYVYTSTSSQEEMFGLATLPADLLDVLAVAVQVRAKKDSAGIANYEIVAKVGANTSTSSQFTTTTTYLTQTLLLEAEPGGGAWNVSDAQNMQIGFQTV